MDRHHLMRRHDEELTNAARATSEAARIAHEGLANVFMEAAERIGSSSTVANDPTPPEGLTA